VKKGSKHSLKTRRKLSAINRGKQIPVETRLKISKTLTGRKRSLESVENSAAGHRGRSLSEEHRRKLSEVKRGKKLSPEHCAKISESQRGDKNHRWKGGISFEPYCVKFDDPFKERCRNFFGRKCAECGKTEEENGERLAVHHVNFDKMSCCNDKKPLYVALCNSCHGKTQNDREYWEQHFTELIDEKYGGHCYLPKIPRREYA